MTEHYTHATIPCEVLDQRAHLPSDERIRAAPDVFDQYRMLARKAQIHLEALREMAREEEEEAQQ